ncbi:MAG: hypothetical protein IIB55_03310 [Planctomycetes bacterium]|nr:hypothetical protein [Planctomycetota bacterium]
MNPNDYPNAIYLSAMDSSGTEIDRVILAEIPAQGQDAFLIDEVMSPLLGEMAVIARGQEGPIQSFFLIGDYALRRLDGVAGEFQASTSLYFPVIPQGNNGSTMLFVFNPTIETASALFRQLDPDGVLVEEVSRTIAAGGFLAQTLEDLFDDSGGGEIYIQVEADVPLMGFEFSPGAEDFSALAAQVPQSATRLLLPHFFVDDRGSQTEIRLLQTDDTPVAVTIRAFDDDSLLLGQTQFELAPDTLFVGELAELLNLDLVGHEFGITGYLEVEFEEMASVVGAVTFTSSAGGGRATRATRGGRHRGSASLGGATVRRRHACAAPRADPGQRIRAGRVPRIEYESSRGRRPRRATEPRAAAGPDRPGVARESRVRAVGRPGPRPAAALTPG